MKTTYCQRKQRVFPGGRRKKRRAGRGQCAENRHKHLLPVSAVQIAAALGFACARSAVSGASVACRRASCCSAPHRLTKSHQKGALFRAPLFPILILPRTDHNIPSHFHPVGRPEVLSISSPRQTSPVVLTPAQPPPSAAAPPQSLLNRRPAVAPTVFVQPPLAATRSIIPAAPHSATLQTRIKKGAPLRAPFSHSHPTTRRP